MQSAHLNAYHCGQCLERQQFRVMGMPRQPARTLHRVVRRCVRPPESYVRYDYTDTPSCWAQPLAKSAGSRRRPGEWTALLRHAHHGAMRLVEVNSGCGSVR
jgi:hypothetical protein